jgi:hypothetical protein
MKSLIFGFRSDTGLTSLSPSAAASGAAIGVDEPTGIRE